MRTRARPPDTIISPKSQLSETLGFKLSTKTAGIIFQTSRRLTTLRKINADGNYINYFQMETM